VNGKKLWDWPYFSDSPRFIHILTVSGPETVRCGKKSANSGLGTMFCGKKPYLSGPDPVGFNPDLTGFNTNLTGFNLYLTGSGPEPGTIETTLYVVSFTGKKAETTLYMGGNSLW
jgi:hypothetical protein